MRRYDPASMIFLKLLFGRHKIWRCIDRIYQQTLVFFVSGRNCGSSLEEHTGKIVRWNPRWWLYLQPWNSSPGGEIGRRTVFRSQREQSCAGSNPVLGTITERERERGAFPLFLFLFLFLHSVFLFPPCFSFSFSALFLFLLLWQRKKIPGSKVPYCVCVVG